MSDIREYVLNHDLFCHHDHHRTYQEFDAERDQYDFRHVLGYAVPDLSVAAGTGYARGPVTREEMEKYWPKIRTTGYGRAVVLGTRELFGLEYAPENFDAITEALQASIRDKSAEEVYEYFVHERARNRWTIQDGYFRCWAPRQSTRTTMPEGQFPDSYRFAFRFDDLLAMVDEGPIRTLECFLDRPLYTLDALVTGLNEAISRFRDTGKLAAIKIGMAYSRDLTVFDPTRSEAEAAFNRIRNRKAFWDGIQQNSGAVDAASARALGDYMCHVLIQRAADENLPVQIHTGYLAGIFGSLAGTKALNLIPIFDKYRTVRFDIFHASWPWASELGAIAKNFPNVWPDMSWAWTMNPTECGRALSEWLDGVPFNKIFAYGADTGLPWCNVGYSIQAKLGIARVLEEKIEAGYFDEATAREVASAIMLENGQEFYGLH